MSEVSFEEAAEVVNSAITAALKLQLGWNETITMAVQAMEAMGYKIVSDRPACTCGEVHVGGKPTGNYNLNLDCPTHGVGTEWYRSPEQVAKRKAQNERLIDLQRQARAARKAAARKAVADES